MTYRSDAGGIVLGPTGRIVLVLQRNGTWSLPKGGVQDGEHHADAARREVAEETGLTDLTQIETLGSYTRYTIDEQGREDKSRLKRITVLLFTTKETDLRPADARIREARWMKPSEAVEVLTVPKDQEFLKSVLHRF